MDLSFVIRGLIIGFSIAAPVGPIGVLCIRRTLAEGRTYGLISGLGAATADAIYGCIAGFGLTFVSGFLFSQQVWLRLAGGFFLCLLGIRSFMSKPKKITIPVKGKGTINAYASTFFLTISNPMTLLSFVGIFAGLGAGSADGNHVGAVLLVFGIFIGSTLWWLILSGSVSLFRTKLWPSGLQWVNRISGVILTGFGLIALFSALL